MYQQDSPRRDFNNRRACNVVSVIYAAELIAPNYGSNETSIDLHDAGGITHFFHFSLGALLMPRAFDLQGCEHGHHSYRLQ